jgi:2-hydroxychromene-2-carboxylate isomerase
MAGDLDFFFFIGSVYTYLAVMRIEALAGAAGARIRWRPFNVRAIMIEQNNIPFRGKPIKTKYMWRDAERRAARHGIPFAGPPPYPVDPENLANRVGIVAAEEGWCAEYTKATYRAWFLAHKAPGEPEHLASIVRAIGKDPDAVVAQANSRRINERYDAETEAARQLGIFGSPTFAVGDEIFWGDDRLEDALLWWRGQKV